MSKQNRKRKKQNKVLGIVLILVLVVIFIMGLFMLKNMKKSIEDEKNDKINKQEEKTEDLEFPYQLEEGKLIVNSLFQYSGANPDNDDEFQDEIAAIEIENQSGEYLAEANIEVKMQDDEKLNFIITDVPSGKKVWAFSTESEGYKQEEKCLEILCKSKFEANPIMMDSQLTINAEGNTVTVSNNSQEEFENLDVAYRCKFEDAYFGGLTYHHKIEKLSVGESVSFEAEECYMGDVEVIKCQDSRK